ncbi:hypothetical protein BYT27DRAFT_7209476 [Phlegmacium glaucopus]|nr:hypothetical protein BYT27DRAFT_7209476 [Phlegmacium glaucopus]
MPSPCNSLPPNVLLDDPFANATGRTIVGVWRTAIPLGQKPLLPSQILALGSEVVVVYGYDRKGITTELRSPPRSPPLTQLISRSSVLESNGTPPLAGAIDLGSASPPALSGMGVVLDATHGLAARVYEYLYTQGDSVVGAEVHDYDDASDGDGDVDRFMDQFMDHYTGRKTSETTKAGWAWQEHEPHWQCDFGIHFEDEDQNDKNRYDDDDEAHISGGDNIQHQPPRISSPLVLIKRLLIQYHIPSLFQWIKANGHRGGERAEDHSITTLGGWRRVYAVVMNQSEGNDGEKDVDDGMKSEVVSQEREDRKER